MAPTDLTDLIDEALERFRGRALVTGDEIVDLLLDLRLATLADLPSLDEIDEIERAEPVPSH